jgi:hypothetical protein
LNNLHSIATKIRASYAIGAGAAKYSVNFIAVDTWSNCPSKITIEEKKRQLS